MDRNGYEAVQHNCHWSMTCLGRPGPYHVDTSHTIMEQLLTIRVHSLMESVQHPKPTISPKPLEP